MHCPTCNAEDWKRVRTDHTFIHQACGNCGYSPYKDRPEVATHLEAKEFIARLSADLGAANEAIKRTERSRDEHQDKESVDWLIANAKLEGAQHQQWVILKKLEVLTQALKVTDTTPESGQVLVHCPEIGFMYQFTWGDYDLLKSLSK